MVIYLDESGDLGFDRNKNNTSEFFTITILICHSLKTQNEFRNAVRKTLRNKLNHRKRNQRIVHELKGQETSFSVKAYFYDHLPAEGWSLYSVSLNKRRVKPDLQSKKGKKKLYNFLARFLLEKIVFAKNIPSVNLVVDKCKNTEEIRDFNTYIENQLLGLLPLNTRLYISHTASHNDAGLQAVDMFCWGIARKDSHGDKTWYQLYQHRIDYETSYLPE